MKVKKEQSKEDYLRMIYLLDNQGVKSVDLAKELGISKPSVSEMLRKLHKQGLVISKPYSKVFLTKKGEEIAEKLFDRHMIIKRFFQKFLNYESEKARQEAHSLEHHFSEESIAKMSEFIDGKKQFSMPSYVG